MWCPSGKDEHCPDDQLCFAFSECHAADMNSQTLAQIEKEKEETYGHLSVTNTDGGGGGAANSFATGGSSGGTGGSSSGGGVTPAPIPADEVPGYYDVILGGSTRPTRMPTKRPTNKPSINAEQAMHRYSFCGKFWTDVSGYKAFAAM